MQCTRFFDESEVSPGLHVRDVSARPATEREPLSGGGLLSVSRPAQSFACAGALPVPELTATLSWWLEEPGAASSSAAAVVHLLLTADKDSGGLTSAAQVTTMAVEVPVEGGAAALLTCGVTKAARGGRYSACVAWMSTSMDVGFLRVLMQRDAHSAGALLLTPVGEIVRSRRPVEALRHITAAMADGHSADRTRGGGTATSGEHEGSLVYHNGVATPAARAGASSRAGSVVPFLEGKGGATSAGRSRAHVSACVVGQVPVIDVTSRWEQYDVLLDDNRSSTSDEGTKVQARRTTEAEAVAGGSSAGAAVAAIFAVCDGANVWRVKLLESGETSSLRLQDSKKREQLGLLCARLLAAMESQPSSHGGSDGDTDTGATLFAGLANVQRLTRYRDGTRHSIHGKDGSAESRRRSTRNPPATGGDGGSDDGDDDGELMFAFDGSHHASPQPPPAAGAAPPTPTQRGGLLSRVLSSLSRGVGRSSGGSARDAAPAAPPRRYLVVSAVQNSSFVAVVRWNGLIEFYDSELETVTHFPSCFIPAREAAPALSSTDASAAGTALTTTAVRQWSTLNRRTNAIHVFTCFGTLEGQRCVWARVPQVGRTLDERVALRSTYGVLAPTAGGVPLACAVEGDSETLAVLWDVGVEEDAHLCPARTVSALLDATRPPAHAALQFVRAHRGAEEAWVWDSTETYACLGGSRRSGWAGGLRALVGLEKGFVVVERRMDYHRAYVVAPAAGSALDADTAAGIARLVESVRVNDPEEGEDYEDDSSESGDALCRAAADGVAGSGELSRSAVRELRLVPLMEQSSVSCDAEDDFSPSGRGSLLDASHEPASTSLWTSVAYRGFWRGVDAAQSCASGSRLLAAVLQAALMAAASPHLLLATATRLVDEAALFTCGGVQQYVACTADTIASAETLERMAHAAVAEASRISSSSPAAAAAHDVLFCSFSRTYIAHAVLRSLLQRIAFLAVTLVGVCDERARQGHDELQLSSRLSPTAALMDGDAPLQLLVRAIQLLSAAYHAACAAGPELPRLALQPQPSAGVVTPVRSAARVRARVSGGGLADAILSELLHDAPLEGEASSSAVRLTAATAATAVTAASHEHVAAFVTRVAATLHRAGSSQTARASAMWAAQLRHRFPLLAHFSLLQDVDAGRTTHSVQQAHLCMGVMSSLAVLGAESQPAGVAGGDKDESQTQQQEEEEEEMLVVLLPRDVLAEVLLQHGLLVADEGCSSSFARVVSAAVESAAFAPQDATSSLRQWMTLCPALVPKLYAVGILRRLVPCLGASGSRGGATTPVHRRANAWLVRGFYLIHLEQVRRSVRAVEKRAAAATAASLQDFASALDELRVDTLLYLAESAAAACDCEACWQHTASALELLHDEPHALPAYRDAIHGVVEQLLDCATSSQTRMDELVAVAGSTCSTADLEGLLVDKWYNAIARLPTKSATDATEGLRYRAVMGLNRFLLTRHAYGQCGRMMSDLASLLRCSPRRGTDGGPTLAVRELAALAVQAVELIAPEAPLSSAALRGNGALHSGAGAGQLGGSPLSAGLSWRAPPHLLPRRGGSLSRALAPAAWGSSNTAEEEDDGEQPEAAAASSAAAGDEQRPASRSVLTRDDLPWLRRREYQAHCERRLWQRGCTLDCSDIWVEKGPRAAYQASMDALIRALETAELWPEAHRLASLAPGCDAVAVLQDWAVHLIHRTRDNQREQRLPLPERARPPSSPLHTVAARFDVTADDISDEWMEIVAYCADQSSLANQFAGFRRVLLTALTTDYDRTAPELLLAHRRADPYSAAVTLLQAFASLRERSSSTARRLAHTDGCGGGGSNSISSADDGDDDASEEVVVVDNSPGQSPFGAGQGNRDSDEEASQRGEATRSSSAARVHRTPAELAERAMNEEARCWRAWAEAAHVCIDVLSSTRGPKSSMRVFTAGVIDPIARCAAELPHVSAKVKRTFEQKNGFALDDVARDFAQSMQLH